MLKVFVAVVIAIGGGFAYWRWQFADSAPRRPASTAAPVSAKAEPTTLAPPPVAPSVEPTLSAEDAAFLSALIERLNKTSLPPADEDLARVDQMLKANPGIGQVKELLVSLYFNRGLYELRGGKLAIVEERLARLKELDGKNAEIYRLQADLRIRQKDWPGALEAIAQHETLKGGATLDSSYTTALANEGWGKRAEALAALARPVFVACDGPTTPSDQQVCMNAKEMREALNQVPANAERRRAEVVVDPAKSKLASDRFDIRFDGETQQGVARDVRVVLERAWARLATIYYDQPKRKVPVVLHTQASYYSATGAPWWSGGQFSSHNGAIQIPVKGMPSSLPRELEDVLVHELSHAFVDEMSGGHAARELQEGLAQYMEGKRVESELTPQQRKELATSADPNGVAAFYMRSLVMVQNVVQSRGQGSVNDALRAMKESGSEDGGFMKIFGRGWTDLKRDAFEIFWRRYS
jgi:hypothetical protein